MRKIDLFLTLCAVSLILGGVSFAQKSPKRDLKLYDDGGTFDFNWGVLAKHNQMGEQLREFVWKKWSTKTRGRVDAIHYSIEGDPVSRRVYIEPNSDGIWQITSVWDSYCCALYTLERPRRKRVHRRGVDIYKVVERIEAAFTGLAQYPPKTRSTVPPGEDRSADKYLLLLRNEPDDEYPLTL